MHLYSKWSLVSDSNPPEAAGGHLLTHQLPFVPAGFRYMCPLSQQVRLKEALEQRQPSLPSMWTTSCLSDTIRMMTSLVSLCQGTQVTSADGTLAGGMKSPNQGSLHKTPT